VKVRRLTDAVLVCELDGVLRFILVLPWPARPLCR
jgi:hypothetical protein